nr:hypothetical protein [Cytobacillus purgationiresistens]
MRIREKPSEDHFHLYLYEEPVSETFSWQLQSFHLANNFQFLFFLIALKRRISLFVAVCNRGPD